MVLSRGPLAPTQVEPSPERSRARAVDPVVDRGGVGHAPRRGRHRRRRVTGEVPVHPSGGVERQREASQSSMGTSPSPNTRVLRVRPRVVAARRARPGRRARARWSSPSLKPACGVDRAPAGLEGQACRGRGRSSRARCRGGARRRRSWRPGSAGTGCPRARGSRGRRRRRTPSRSARRRRPRPRPSSGSRRRGRRRTSAPGCRRRRPRTRRPRPARRAARSGRAVSASSTEETRAVAPVASTSATWSGLRIDRGDLVPRLDQQRVPGGERSCRVRRRW